MKREIQLKVFLAALQKQKFKKHIQLNIEGNKNQNSFKLKIKSISVPRELYEEIGFDDQEVIDDKGVDVPKKPTIRELIINLESNMNTRFNNVEKRLDNLEARVEEMANTPTMKKELEQTKKSA